jgi:hypothetical protein
MESSHSSAAAAQYEAVLRLFTDPNTHGLVDRQVQALQTFSRRHAGG